MSFRVVADRYEWWKPIPGFEGYELSTYGRVRSYWGKGGASQGRRGLVKTPKIVGGYLTASGHKFAVLTKRPGTRQTRLSIHVLVLSTFIEPRPMNLFACHRDGNPHNNHVSNLYWGTQGQNVRDAVLHGRIGKVTRSEVVEIWRLLCLGVPSTEISRQFGISPGAISHIKRGSTWNHVTRYLHGKPSSTSPSIDFRLPVYPSLESRLETEIWEFIEQKEYWRVSNTGRVQTRISKSRLGVPRGSFRLDETWRDLAQSNDKEGYKLVSLGKTTAKVHRLVLSAFAGPCPPGMVACHGDGDKANNHASNLRWDTVANNYKDWQDHARRRKR